MTRWLKKPIRARDASPTARRLRRAGTRSSYAAWPSRGRFRRRNTTRATPASTPRTSARAWLPSSPSASRNSRAASRLDDARGAQPRNLGIALAEEAAQHFIGVLAEQGRREPILDSRHREAHGARDARQLACGRMVQLDPDAAGPDLRLLEYLRHVVDRAVRNAGRFQQLHPLPGAAPDENLLQQPGKLGAIFDALAVAGEARILRQRGASGGRAEFAIQVVVSAGQDHLPVARAERLVGHDIRVQVADALRRHARGEVVGILVGEERDLRVEQREIEMLPEARLRAMRERRADGDRGVHPGDDVGDRDAGALRTAARRAVGLSGDAHHPAHALDHEVVARPLAPGAALAEAGERAVDEPRVSLPQGVVAQAVAGEIAVLVVLDQDIEAVRERTDQRLPLGDRDVHRDRLLAAIRRGEIGGVARLATLAVLDPRRPESARVVAALRPLNLDDLGPEIGQILAGPGSRKHARQVQDADVRQRACHAAVYPG